MTNSCRVGQLSQIMLHVWALAPVEGKRGIATRTESQPGRDWWACGGGGGGRGGGPRSLRAATRDAHSRRPPPSRWAGARSPAPDCRLQIRMAGYEAIKVCSTQVQNLASKEGVLNFVCFKYEPKSCTGATCGGGFMCIEQNMYRTTWTPCGLNTSTQTLHCWTSAEQQPSAVGRHVTYSRRIERLLWLWEVACHRRVFGDCT